ncbi:hypothetical protein G7050_16030 [Dysgonomonas sp. HDW5A]|uniref:hypothetical protein n=1 Tax=Dysgonomonas sp. HDW5A TaxID=2714926 RepID=UPI00140E9261|nr:hypothetical protein [Dysgonomonas sp. HDW5A]QIK61263.1 hypothetical protein G7050_16030 [Dysgonomonas sp. HDW5A]
MNEEIKALIQREGNEHKDQTDYIASQEYISGCSNDNDKLFCWEASTACSIQARESFQAGANFALSLFKWRKGEDSKLRIHTIGNNNLFKYTVANYLGVNPEIGRVKLCRLLKRNNMTLVIENIFEEWRSMPSEHFKSQDRRGFDIGLHQLRILIGQKLT